MKPAWTHEERVQFLRYIEQGYQMMVRDDRGNLCPGYDTPHLVRLLDRIDAPKYDCPLPQTRTSTLEVGCRKGRSDTGRPFLFPRLLAQKP